MIPFLALTIVTFLSFFTSDVASQELTDGGNRITVPMRDSRGIERDGIQALAVRASNKARQVVVLYGPTNETFNEVKEGLESVLNGDKDNAFRALIVASGESEIAYYADGQLTATLLNPSGETLNVLVLQQIYRDYQRVVLARNR